MPWRTATVEKERARFVLDAEVFDLPHAELCRRYGISRPTGTSGSRVPLSAGVPMNYSATTLRCTSKLIPRDVAAACLLGFGDVGPDLMPFGFQS